MALEQAAPELRAAICNSAARALAPYMTDDGLALPMESHFMVARA